MDSMCCFTWGFDLRAGKKNREIQVESGNNGCAVLTVVKVVYLGSGYWQNWPSRAQKGWATNLQAASRPTCRRVGGKTLVASETRLAEFHTRFDSTCLVIIAWS